MTANTFVIECEERLVDPAIALDNDFIRAALEEGDDFLVLELLDSEF
jgi:hypothetical protein